MAKKSRALGKGPESPPQITITQLPGGRMSVFVPAPIYNAICEHNEQIYPSLPETYKQPLAETAPRCAIAIVPLVGDVATRVRKIQAWYDSGQGEWGGD